MKKIFALLLSLSIAPVACASRLSVDDRPCPCAAGWTCCAERDVCVAPGDTCPRVTTDAGDADAAPADARVDELGTIALASDQTVRCMTTDKDHVYWMDAKGRISGAPKRGGEIEKESPRDVFTPRCSLAIEHGLWIWGTSYSDGVVWRKTLTSNGEWRIAGGIGVGYGGAELTTPSSVAFDDDWVYVTEYEVGRVRKSARRAEPGNLAPEVVVLAKGRQHPDGVVIDEDYVYWIDRGEDPSNFGAIMKVAKDGWSEPVKLASATDPGGLVLHGDWVYWTELGHVMKIPKVGLVPTLVSDERRSLGGIVTDGTSLFWATATELRQAPLEGGAAVDVPAVHNAPLVAFTADAGWFAWSDGANVWSRAR